MRGVLLSPPPSAMWCPACGLEQLIPAAAKGTPLHPCPSVSGLMAPLVPAGVRAKVERVAREDYALGQELQRDGEGRPAMAVRVTRDDGVDCAVLAPTAVAEVRS